MAGLLSEQALRPGLLGGPLYRFRQPYFATSQGQMAGLNAPPLPAPDTPGILSKLWEGMVASPARHIAQFDDALWGRYPMEVEDQYALAGELAGLTGSGLLTGPVKGAGMGVRTVAGRTRIDPVRPPSEDIGEVASAMSPYAVPAGTKTMAVADLSGGVSGSGSEAARVAALAEKMAADEGYISRLLVDQDGNVIEGQHRLEALRRLGIDDAPVSVIRDLSASFPIDRMESAVRAVGGLRAEQIRGVTREAAQMIAEAGGVAQARKMFDLPKGWERYFNAALDAAESYRTGGHF